METNKTEEKYTEPATLGVALIGLGDSKETMVRFDAMDSLSEHMEGDCESAGPAAMVWVDVETTGLEVHEDSVLEIAIVVTDIMGNVVPRGIFTQCILPALTTLHTVERDPYVLNMHHNSGLLDEIATMDSAVKRGFVSPDELRAGSIDTRALHFVKGHMGGKRVPMAGSSVHFDLGHLKSWDLVSKCFTYRTIDVSGIRELAYLHNPEIVAPDAFKLDFGHEEGPTVSTHRALQDVNLSLQLYRQLLKEFLWTAENAEQAHAVFGGSK